MSLEIRDMSFYFLDLSLQIDASTPQMVPFRFVPQNTNSQDHPFNIVEHHAQETLKLCCRMVGTDPYAQHTHEKCAKTFNL